MYVCMRASAGTDMAQGKWNEVALEVKVAPNRSVLCYY
jgi:hypothetical protein